MVFTLGAGRFMKNAYLWRMKVKLPALMVMALLLVACGHKDFSIKMHVKDLGSESVTALFYDGTGVRTTTLTAQGGKMQIVGSSSTPILVEVKRSNGLALAWVLVKNGDKIEVDADMNQPGQWTTKGAADNDSLAAVAARLHPLLQRGDKRAVRMQLTNLVRKNHDAPWVTAAIMLYYPLDSDPEGAQTLFARLSPGARPASLVEGFTAILTQRAGPTGEDRRVAPFTVRGEKDSLLSVVPTAHPYTLMLFSGENRPDSIKRALLELRKNHSAEQLNIVETTVWGDTMAWRSRMRRDTVTWKRGWAAGAVGNPGLRRIAIPSVPFMVVTDSTGKQIYRGTSIKAMQQKINNRHAH